MNWISATENTPDVSEETLCALIGIKEESKTIAYGFWNKDKNEWDSSQSNLKVLYYFPLHKPPAS